MVNRVHRSEVALHLRGGCVVASLYLVVFFQNLDAVQRVQGQTARLTPSSSANLQDIPGDKRGFFYKRSDFGTTVDSRISKRLETNGAQIRSYAVIIAISEYPKFPNADDRYLAPAAHDLTNLESFLQRQGFDEIIVLDNAAATPDNIRYVLENYLRSQLEIFGGGARVLIAYTGHGTPGGLVLGDATDEKDFDHLYPLNVLEAELKTLSSTCFQFLALINSCNSGGLFSQFVRSGGNDAFPGGSGAHAITASKPDELAYGLPNQGSVFFDIIINGVDTGDADMLFAGWFNRPDGSKHLLGNGIVRLGSLANYLSGELMNTVNPKTDKPYPQPEWGNIRSDRPSEGAFFFLGPPSQPIPSKFGTKMASEITAQDFTGSAITGMPEVKIFKPPDTYEVAGVDVSSFNGTIDWKAIVRNPKLRFAYIRATSRSKSKDKEFDKNWTGARQAGISYGAYYTFDFSKSADEQFQLIKKSIPVDHEALPFAVDVEWYDVPNRENAARAILQLERLCSDYFGKPAVLYGNSQFFAAFDKRISNGDAIWLAQYRRLGGKEDVSTPPNLPGKQPWTIWQFGDSAQIQGISGGTGVNVFFGTAKQFTAFARGDRGVALRAAISRE